MANKGAELLEAPVDYRNLSRLLSYDALLALAILRRYRRLARGKLAQLLGISTSMIDQRLGVLESLGAIRWDKDVVKIRGRGRKIATSLELYKFDFASPESSYTTHLSESKRKRRLAVNDFYFPRDTSAL